MALVHSTCSQLDPNLPLSLVSWEVSFPRSVWKHDSGLNIPRVCSDFVLSSDINITLYPAHILDPTCIFSSVGLCLVD